MATDFTPNDDFNKHQQHVRGRDKLGDAINIFYYF